MSKLQFAFFLFLLIVYANAFKLEGKVSLPSDSTFLETKLVVDYGKYEGFLRGDGSFAVYNVPSGSYVVEVVNPVYFFEPVRVDVSSRGSIRARKLNHLKPSAVSMLKYPLEMKPLALTKYFQVREKFSILDMLKSPMVLMMVLPMLILFILPKMMNVSDPETRREMENSMNMFNQNSNQVPDVAEWLTKRLGGTKKKPAAPKPAVTAPKPSKPTKRRRND